MKQSHAAFGLFTLILFANPAAAQDEATWKTLALNWAGQAERGAGLTLLDDKRLDDTWLLLGKDVRESPAPTILAQARGQREDWTSRPYLADRGDGIHTSLFGTYVRKGELLAYLFYEYTRNKDAEYKPSELGFGLDQDFRGKLEVHETLIFLAYGFTDSLAAEFESAVYTNAVQTKARNDQTGMPRTFREEGVGDTEGQIRYRFLEETALRPELIGFFGVLFPLQTDKKLIGAQDWELSLGGNLTKGFPFGTFMLKAAAGYSDGEQKFEFTDWGIEYVKRLTDLWRLVLSVEGVQTDEIEAVAEVQWKLSANVTLKLNMGFGLTDKAPEYAPEVGVLFSF